MNKDLTPQASNDYDDSRTKTKSKRKSSISAKKMRTSSLGTKPPGADNSFTYVKKHVPKMPPNDFDPETVKNGLDQIDYEIHDIDENIPEEEFELDETEELMRANKILREKVGQISDLVASAITKASMLKKQITTHRDNRRDPELNSKLKEINKYQKAMRKTKVPNNDKVQLMRDEIRLLEEEIAKLEDERDFHKQVNNKLPENPQREKIKKLQQTYHEEKDSIQALEDTRKLQEHEYEETMKEFRKIDSEYRALVEKKNWIKNGKPMDPESEFEKKDKQMAEVQKKKVLKRIAENKVTQVKSKINAQKRKNTQLDKELEDIQKTIQGISILIRHSF